MKHVLASGMLFLASLIFSAILGEGVLRFLGYHGAPQSVISNLYSVEDSVLDWRYIPRSQVTNGKVTNTYNSRGFRDVEHSIQRSPEVTRIVVIGDSVTEGYGVEEESLFARRLQTQLGGRYEVVNMGMAGLNTPQEIHLLEKEGVQYNPALVILNFVLNDADFFTTYRGVQKFLAEKDQNIGLLNLKIDPRVKRLLKSSALIYFLKERFENLHALITGEEGSNYYQELWSNEANRDKVRSGFEQLRALREHFGFETMVVIWPILTDYQDYPFSGIHDWVGIEARKNGFQVLDLLPAFSKMHFRALQVTADDNIHPNALGHKIAAEAVVDIRDRLGALSQR